MLKQNTSVNVKIRYSLSIYSIITLFLLLACFSLSGCGNESVTEKYDHDLIKGSDADEYIDDENSTLHIDDIAGLDADYYIDYENGTIPIGDLPIGTRVIDPTWQWEFRLGFNYSNELGDVQTGPAEVKPIIWIVVAKDHYDGMESHVTLLTKDLIGRYAFDNSTDRDYEGNKFGYNHWGESGNGNATHGLRPWLNSNGIHKGEGFYWAFSESFKGAVLNTTVPNKVWENGTDYSTQDHVFIPSTTELGDITHEVTYPIGSTYPYFEGEVDEKRITMMVGDNWRESNNEYAPGLLYHYNIKGNNWDYWTRSPGSNLGGLVRHVKFSGEFINCKAFDSGDGVRPVLNLKSGVLVSKITGTPAATKILGEPEVDEAERDNHAAKDIKFYSINYANGTIPIGDLPIGSRVVDPSWEWDFRKGFDYLPLNGIEIKPVYWIIVAKDHYEGLENHVTLLSEDLIGLHAFDTSNNGDHEYSEFGYGHWGESGTANATRGIRPWLNSNGIHAKAGFYNAFDENFKNAVIRTTLPNRDYKNGDIYFTIDRVFLPSTTEIGDNDYIYKNEIGTIYDYFFKAAEAKRVASICGEPSMYWTRTPTKSYGFLVYLVGLEGEFFDYSAFTLTGGVRPAVNFKSEILVDGIEN